LVRIARFFKELPFPNSHQRNPLQGRDGLDLDRVVRPALLQPKRLFGRLAERPGAEPMGRLVRQLVSGSEVRFRLEAVGTIPLNGVSHARRFSGTLTESASVCPTDARSILCSRDHAAAGLRIAVSKETGRTVSETKLPTSFSRHEILGFNGQSYLSTHGSHGLEPTKERILKQVLSGFRPSYRGLAQGVDLATSS